MNGNLKKLRESRHLTQSGMGRKFGLAQQTISKYEKDVYAIPAGVLVLMAKYFNVTTDYILGASETKRSAEMESKREYLNEEERFLVRKYNDLNDSSRQIILDMLLSLRNNQK